MIASKKYAKFILVPLLRKDTWQVSATNRIVFFSLSFSFSFAFLVVEIGVQRSVQMAVRDKKNFARIYRYWPIVIDAPPFPVQMGKIVFPFFFFISFFPFFFPQ